MRMSEAYYFNEQKDWVKWRRLYSMIVNMFSEEVVEETKIMWLPLIDKPERKVENLPIRLTPEQIRQEKIKNGIIKE